MSQVSVCKENRQAGQPASVQEGSGAWRLYFRGGAFDAGSGVGAGSNMVVGYPYADGVWNRCSVLLSLSAILVSDRSHRGHHGADPMASRRLQCRGRLGGLLNTRSYRNICRESTSSRKLPITRRLSKAFFCPVTFLFSHGSHSSLSGLLWVDALWRKKCGMTCPFCW